MGFFLGALLTGAGLLGSRSSQRKTARTQDGAIKDWINYQDTAKDATEAAVDARRGTNYGTLGGLMSGATLEARQGLIDGETDRLYDMMLAPENAGAGATGFEARKLAEATQMAREMIRANAKTRAYGGSYGGMAATRGRAMSEGATDIGFQNEMSLGDLSVLQKKQAVQPVMYQHQSTGLGELMTSVGSGMLGQAFAGMGGAAAPATAGNTVSSWVPTASRAAAPAAAAVPGLGFGSMPPIGYLFPPNPNLRFR